MYSSNIVQLMNYIGFATWFSIGAAVACIPYLRWKCPDLERPIKVNLAFPVIYIVMTLVNTVFKCHFETFVGNTYFFIQLSLIFCVQAITILPMIQQPVETAIGLAMILSAVPVYFIFIKWTSKPAFINTFTSGGTQSLQRLLMVVPPSKQA